MRGFFSDIRLACRVLWKRPGFTSIIVLTLALGIGVNSAIFSLFNAVALRPLSVTDPNNLVRLARVSKEGTRLSLSYPEYVTFRGARQSFTTVAARSWTRLLMTDRVSGEEEGIEANLVSASFFSLFKSPVGLGRAFVEAEDQPGAALVAVLGHSAWKKRFGEDPGVVGRQIVLDGHPFTIVGVCSATFTDLSLHTPDVFVPLAAQSVMNPDQLTARGKAWLQMFGLLRPGLVREKALPALNLIAARFDTESGANHPANVALLDLPRSGPGTREIVFVMSSVGLVLLIACANVSNLIMARATSRRKEFAVRVSLGASRLRMARHCLAEGLVLALLGAAFGLLGGYWMADALLAAVGVLPDLDLTPDIRVVSYALFLSVVALLFSGAGPAIRGTRMNANQVLKEETSLSGFHTPFRRNLLVTCQVGASIALLIVAGLFLKGFYAAAFADRGFDVAGVVKIKVRTKEHDQNATRSEFLRRQVISTLKGLNGVTAVSCVVNPPYGHAGRTDLIPAEGLRVGVNSVSEGYFETLRIRFLGGRDFLPEDTRGQASQVIISKSLAVRLCPRGENAVGRSIQLAGEPSPLRILGIVNDLVIDEPAPYLYRPIQESEMKGAVILLRASGDPRPLTAAIRREITSLDSSLQPEITFLEKSMDESMRGARADSILWGSLAGLGTLLAVIGIYGVLSFSMAQRRREAGVRMALGADSGRIVRTMMVQALMPVGMGVVVGVSLAVAASRLLGARLHGLNPLDPTVYAGLALFMTLVALIAAYVPVRRLSRIDPVQALRYE